MTICKQMVQIILVCFRVKPIEPNTRQIKEFNNKLRYKV